MAKIYRHKFGTPAYPIPITDKLTGEITWLADEESAIYIPTMRDEDKDRIYGRLIRQVVTDPTMMKDMTEMLLRLDKSRTPEESKSYGYTTMGAPGNGKTYLAKAIGELVHPKGAIIVDCNNIDNPDELFKVTTFSVDQTRKQRKIDARVRMGNHDPELALSQNAIAYMKKMFGNSIVTQETRDGRRITAIDWNAINQTASYIEAVVDKVMEMEQIPYEKDASSLGFVVSNGPLLQALTNPDSPDYGRVVIRDEANRGPAVDAWLRIQAFFSEPSADELKLKGEDDKEMIIKRENIPDTFLFLGTANEATEEMGLSAKELTKPMISREGMGIDIRQISNPEKEDFISRTLKHLTGVPAYHVYMMDTAYYDENPQQLSETLMYLRTVGLTAEERKKIPAEEKFNIEHIDRTINVAIQYGSLIAETENLIQQAIKDESLPPAYIDYLQNHVVLDLRYIYKLYQHSKIAQPTGNRKSKDMFKGLGKKEKTQSQDEISWEMKKRFATREKDQFLTRGTRLENEIASKLHDIIIPDSVNNMLKTSETLKEDYEKIQGIWKSLVHTAKGLHFEFAGYIGKDSVAQLYNATSEDMPNRAIDELKDTLLSSINEEYNTSLTAEDVLDDETLLEASKMFSQIDELKHIFTPNHNLETSSKTPVLKTYVSSQQKEPLNRDELITTSQFVDSLIIKGMRKQNIRKYAQEIPNVGKEDGSPASRCIAFGSHPDFFATSVVMNNNKDNSYGFASIVYNKQNNQALVLSNFEISPTKKSQLSKSGVLFVNITKKQSEKQTSENYEIINNYLQSQIKQYDSELTSDHIVSALMLRIEKDLAEAGGIEDYCEYLSNMDTQELIKKDVVALSNIKYEESNTIDQILKQKTSRRR